MSDARSCDSPATSTSGNDVQNPSRDQRLVPRCWTTVAKTPETVPTSTMVAFGSGDGITSRADGRHLPHRVRLLQTPVAQARLVVISLKVWPRSHVTHTLSLCSKSTTEAHPETQTTSELDGSTAIETVAPWEIGPSTKDEGDQKTNSTGFANA